MMGLAESKSRFEAAFNKTTEERLGLINSISVPSRDLPVLISDKVAESIISNQPAVYNSSNQLGIKQRALNLLRQASASTDIGANNFFGNLSRLSNLSFLYNPTTVFDYVRPLVSQIGLSLSDGLLGMFSFKSLITEYNTFIQSVPRSRIDAVDTPLIKTQSADVKNIKDRVRTLNNTYQTKGFIDEPERQSIVNDIDTLFNSVTGSDATFPQLERQLSEITNSSATLKTCLTDVLNKKGQMETFVDNYKNDLNLTPLTQSTFATAESGLDTIKLKLDAVAERENKFLGVNSQNGISQDLQTVKTLLSTIPSNVPTEVDGAPAKPTYDTLASDFVAIPTTNIQDAINKIEDITKKAQVTVVRDINSSFSSDVAATVAAIDLATADMGGLKTALNTYGSPENTKIGNSSLDTVIDGGLDNIQDRLTTGAFQDFSAVATNQATLAGDLASELAKEIALTSNEEGGKRLALQLARNIMVGLEQTNLIAARAVENELPGAVSTLSQIEREVQNALGLIDQFA